MAIDLPPTFEFALQASPGANRMGWMEAPGMVVAGSPPMVYVAEPVWNATWGGWLRWHSPTVAMAIGFLAVLAAYWWIRRVWRRPRQGGRMYCRGCNYQLTSAQLKLNEEGRAIWANEDARCPECGLRHKRGPVRGRLRSTRMTAALVAVPVVLGICALTMLATLQFHQARPWASATWPALGMEKLFGAWALERRTTSMDVQSLRFWRIDPRTNEVEEVGAANSIFYGMMEFVSPDGRFLVVAVENSRGLLVIDLKDHSRRIFPRAGPDQSTFVLHQFSNDGKRVFLTRSKYTMTGGRKEDFMEFDPKAGELKELGTVDLPPDVGVSGMVSMPQFVFQEMPSSMVWVHQQIVRNPNGTSTVSTIRWEADGKKMERKEESANGGFQIGLSADGTACILANPVTRTERAFTLATGESLKAIPPMGPGADWQWNWGGARDIQYTGNPVIAVKSLKGNRREVGTIKVSKECWPRGSADGRFACGWIDRDVAPSLIGSMLESLPTKAPVVRVWDFEKLLDAETELPIGVAVPKNSAP